MSPSLPLLKLSLPSTSSPTSRRSARSIGPMPGRLEEQLPMGSSLSWPPTSRKALSHREPSVLSISPRWGRSLHCLCCAHMLLYSSSLSPYQPQHQHKVTQFQLKGWSDDGLCTEPRALLELIEHVGAVQRKTGNNAIVVHGV